MLRSLDKKVISFRNGADEFLKGLSSNLPAAPKNAFLDVRGNIVATFYQVRLRDGAVLACVEAPFMERVFAHLKNHIALSDVLMVEEPSFRCYFDLDGTARPPRGAVIIPEGPGALIITGTELASEVSDADFTWFRLKNELPVQGIDYDREMLLNLGDESYVSYQKGCFLGQEIIARVHHRARPPKKLIVSRLDRLSPAEVARATSVARSPEDGAEHGFLFAENR